MNFFSKSYSIFLYILALIFVISLALAKIMQIFFATCSVDLAIRFQCIFIMPKCQPRVLVAAYTSSCSAAYRRLNCYCHRRVVSVC